MASKWPPTQHEQKDNFIFPQIFTIIHPNSISGYSLDSYLSLKSTGNQLPSPINFIPLTSHIQLFLSTFMTAAIDYTLITSHQDCGCNCSLHQQVPPFSIHTLHCRQKPYLKQRHNNFFSWIKKLLTSIPQDKVQTLWYGRQDPPGFVTYLELTSSAFTIFCFSIAAYNLGFNQRKLISEMKIRLVFKSISFFNSRYTLQASCSSPYYQYCQCR